MCLIKCVTETTITYVFVCIWKVVKKSGGGYHFLCGEYFRERFHWRNWRTVSVCCVSICVVHEDWSHLQSNRTDCHQSKVAKKKVQHAINLKTQLGAKIMDMTRYIIWLATGAEEMVTSGVARSSENHMCVLYTKKCKNHIFPYKLWFIKKDWLCTKMESLQTVIVSKKCQKADATFTW